MKPTYLDLACHDLEAPYVVGDLVDHFFRCRENRIVLGALIHHHRTHRRETRD